MFVIPIKKSEEKSCTTCFYAIFTLGECAHPDNESAKMKEVLHNCVNKKYALWKDKKEL